MTVATEKNFAFIDGQNLHLGTLQSGWKIDYAKFRKYLNDKYHVTEAYYFLGYDSDDHHYLYQNLRKAGFILLFKEHSSNLKGMKKGNVDTDIVFEIMKTLIERTDFQQMLLISGDGDFKKVVDYLINKNRLKKILFPNRKFASSLYRHLEPAYFDSLDTQSLRNKIAFSN